MNSIETYSNIPSFSSSNASKANNATSKSSSTSKSVDHSKSNPSSSSASTTDLMQNSKGGRHYELNNSLVSAAAASKNIDYVGDFLRSQQKSCDSVSGGNMIAIAMDSLSELLLETGVFVAGFKKSSNQTSLVVRRASSMDGHTTLSTGDRIISINGVSLVNKSLSNLGAKFFQNYDTFHLMIQKMNVPSNQNANLINCHAAAVANPSFYFYFLRLE
jgi:hypothetical protein